MEAITLVACIPKGCHHLRPVQKGPVMPHEEVSDAEMGELLAANRGDWT